jgi:hypothetical protein
VGLGLVEGLSTSRIQWVGNYDICFVYSGEENNAELRVRIVRYLPSFCLRRSNRRRGDFTDCDISSSDPDPTDD